MNTDNPLLAEFVTTKQLAELFGKSPRTIERWVRLRILPEPRKVGRDRLHHIPTVRASLAKDAA